jgi:hypothetical protein
MERAYAQSFRPRDTRHRHCRHTLPDQGRAMITILVTGAIMLARHLKARRRP